MAESIKGCLLAPMRITVDPGHGGTDPGAAAGGIVEKDLVLVYSEFLFEELNRRGHYAMTTRSTDQFVALAARAAAANAYGALAFVSVHANASDDVDSRGAWVLHYKGSAAGKALGLRIAERLRCVPGATRSALPVYPDDSGYTGGRGLAVLRRTTMPAVLVEIGFLTNPDDRKLLTQDVMPGLFARAIVDGIEDWVRRDMR